jgi:hypothetical protein
MRFRSSVLLFALPALACSRKAEPSPTPAITLAASATRLPTAIPVASSTAATVHDRDMPDTFVHPPSDNAKQIKAWHILIAYQGAENAAPTVTRSKADAKALADHVALEARAGGDFEALAEKYSDDPSAKMNKGYLGVITREQMPKPFSDAAFGLLKHEVAIDPVETPLGFHIIKRTE